MKSYLNPLVCQCLQIFVYLNLFVCLTLISSSFLLLPLLVPVQLLDLLLLVDEHHKEDVVRLDEDLDSNLLVLCLHPQDLLLYLLLQFDEDVLNLLVLVVEEHHLHLCVLLQLIVLRLSAASLAPPRLMLLWLL